MSVSEAKYSRVARILHWSMGVLIVANLAGGLLHDLNAGLIMPLHKATGVLLLTLAVLRILWRMVKPAPAFPAEMSLGERAAASFTHAILYAFMVLIPLSGWIMVSAFPNPLPFYGLFELPKFHIVKESALWGVAAEGHELMAFALIALLLLHIAAALRHHFVLKDGILARMWG